MLLILVHSVVCTDGIRVHDKCERHTSVGRLVEVWTNNDRDTMNSPTASAYFFIIFDSLVRVLVTKLLQMVDSVLLLFDLLLVGPHFNCH